MGRMRELVLSEAERAALVRIREHDPVPYKRERAAALLKVAAGTPAARVAREGLLRRRKAETVYGWLDRWAREGLASLRVRPGRGRKPAFSP